LGPSQTCSESCNPDAVELIAALNQHKAEQNESLQALKAVLESRIGFLEDRVNSLDAVHSFKNVTNLVKSMHAHLDEAYIKMQDYLERAQKELVDTASDLAAKLRCSGADITPLSNGEVPPNLVIRRVPSQLEGCTSLRSQEVTMAHGGQDVQQERARRHSCPPILEENEEEMKQQEAFSSPRLCSHSKSGGTCHEDEAHNPHQRLAAWGSGTLQNIKSSSDRLQRAAFGLDSDTDLKSQSVVQLFSQPSEHVREGAGFNVVGEQPSVVASRPQICTVPVPAALKVPSLIGAT